MKQWVGKNRSQAQEKTLGDKQDKLVLSWLGKTAKLFSIFIFNFLFLLLNHYYEGEVWERSHITITKKGVTLVTVTGHSHNTW